MKFCCENFKTRHQALPSYEFNIRIIKLSNKFLDESKRRGFPILKKELYNFILTEGYEDNQLDLKVKVSFINYCPYCGVNLKKFYKKDCYINEKNHVW